MNSKNFDGFGSALALLEGLDEAAQERLITDISEKDPSLASKLRRHLVSFDDILTIPSRSLQSLIGNSDLRTWAIAFRDASHDVKNHVCANLPETQAQLLLQETDNIGPQPRKDVEKAKTDLLSLAKKLNLL